ncbi:MAG: cobalt ABC transporter permease [Phycisphaerae bacterium]|nr:cobalt ABC transporter permease [Phycisphaerae bacterium]
MKRSWVLPVLIVLALAGVLLAIYLSRASWAGVDDRVVGKFATEAGRPPVEPRISGDLLLFFFLLAGAVGGFVAGYVFRGLFPPRAKKGNDGE